MMTYRPFAEVVAAYRMRFEGLLEEYETIEHKWRYLNSIVMDERIFPDLAETVFKVVPRLMDKINEEMKECEKIGESSFASDVKSRRDARMKRVAKLLFLTARFVSYFKSAMYQRTPFLEIPFVIAGEPVSPETRWGEELYLIAADNLVKNYSEQLNLSGFKWSGFTSYAPMHPHYERFPGATYTNISSFIYYVALSSDLKNSLRAYMVLAHELGHAAIESRETVTKSGNVPIIMFNFLSDLFAVRRILYKAFKNAAKKGKSICRKCSLRKSVRRIAVLGSMDDEDFVNLMRQNSLNELLYEIVSDCIGSFIAGPYYVRATFNYAFRNVVSTHEDQEPELDEHFRKLLARVVSCSKFIKSRGLEWSDTSQKVLENITTETFASISSVESPKKESVYDCLDCIRGFGNIIGQVLGEDFGFIFKGVFRRTAAFCADPSVEDCLSRGMTTCNVEPRQIVHACFGLQGNNSSESPVAVFSLANNSKYLRRSQYLTELPHDLTDRSP